MKKRNEYDNNIWGFLRFIFQKAFLKGLAVVIVVIFALYMWSNFSCDKAQGPRIENTEVKVKLGEKQ